MNVRCGFQSEPKSRVSGPGQKNFEKSNFLTLLGPKNVFFDLKSVEKQIFPIYGALAQLIFFQIFFQKKVFRYTFYMILIRFEQKIDLLDKILDFGSLYVQSIYPFSCIISTYRSTTLPKDLLIALLVWLQSCSKVAIFNEKHDFLRNSSKSQPS